MSDVDKILQPNDMVATRTPKELCDWVDSIALQFSESEEGKRYSRSGALLPKKLWEEIRPLALFSFRRFGVRDDIKCTPNLNNENFDDRIDFEGSSIPSIYVEITYAKDGYDESLRLEVLNAKGSVNALGRVSTSGTKAAGGRTIDVENEAVNHQDTLYRAIALVKERIRGKSGKVYGPNYVLVIVVDDYLPFRTAGDQETLMKHARVSAKCVKLDFKEIVLLGASGNYMATVCGEI